VAAKATVETPHYKNPPVNEVICGVLFESMDELLSPYTGLLWEVFKDDYPTCEEQPPIVPAIERYDDTPQASDPTAGFLPYPRIWFVHRDGTGVIQIQRDRFLHNWRRLQEDDEYPRYETVIEVFKERLSRFEAFLEEHELPRMKPLQYELTYSNPIPQGEAWASLEEIGGLLPDSSWRKDDGRFLPDPSAINWRTSFDMPDRLGRLHVTAKTAMRRSDRKPLMVLELTARGFVPQHDAVAMSQWFDAAHKWIVCGFEDLTSEKVQADVWGKIV
jgi:uncharacterized protein (TIGR04255 family)